MNPEAMRPYGVALLDYYHGKQSATITFFRDDGLKEEMPVSYFFREPRADNLESAALDLCHGYTLDIGAGIGIHSSYLQQQGFKVCAIDISREAVTIMRGRGVVDVRQLDVMSFENEKFDTALMMGHGIGMVETIGGLSNFLKYTLNLIQPGGQILLTSLDVRKTDDPRNLQYHKKNIEAGRYIGEIRMRCEYGLIKGPVFSWLHIDSEMLKSDASKAGWYCEVIQQKSDGNYLARLSRGLS